MLAEQPLPVGVVGRCIDELEVDDAAGQAERGLHRVREAPPRGCLHGEPVDDDLDGVLLLLLQGGRLGEQVHGAVDAGAAEALGLQLAEQVGVLALALPDDGSENLELRALGQVEDAVDDLLRRLAPHGLPARRAVRLADPGEQQAQVVIDLGDGADSRAGVARGGLLVDRDRRGQPVDEVHVGLVHLAEELACVGAQRLHVAALALGEDRVEREARLARAREAGEHDQGIARDGQGHVLEVVLPGAPHGEAVVMVLGQIHAPILGQPSDIGSRRQAKAVELSARVRVAGA